MDLQKKDSDTSQFVNVKTEIHDESWLALMPAEATVQGQLQDNYNVQVKTERPDDEPDLLHSEAIPSAQCGEGNLNVQDQRERSDDEPVLCSESMPPALSENRNLNVQIKTETPIDEESELLRFDTELASRPTSNEENVIPKDEEDDINDDDATPEKIVDESDDDMLMSLGSSKTNANADNSVNASQQQPRCEASNKNVCNQDSKDDAPIFKISVKNLNKLIETTQTIETVTETNANNDNVQTTEKSLNINDNNSKNAEDLRNDLDGLTKTVSPSAHSEVSNANSEFDDGEVPSDYFDELLNSPSDTKNFKQEANDNASEQLTEDLNLNTQTGEEHNKEYFEHMRQLKNIKKEKEQVVEKKHKRSRKRKHRKYSSSSDDDESYRRNRSRERSRSRKRSRSRGKSRSRKRRRSYSRSRSKSRNRSRRHKKERHSRSLSRHRNERKRQQESSTRRDYNKRDRDSHSPELRMRSDEVPKFKLIKLENILETAPTTTIPPPPSLEKKDTKVEKAILRVRMHYKTFKENKISDLNNGFVFTQTIIPMKSTKSSNSNFKNRSPLCSLYNVIYPCTSIRPRIPLSAYGFQQPSKQTVEILRLVYINSLRLEDRSKSVKMPPKLLRMIKNSNEESESFQRDAQCQTESKSRDVATQYCNKNLIDISQMTEKQKYAIFLCEEMIKMLPNSELDEMQQNRRLIDAIKVARGTLKIIKREY